VIASAAVELARLAVQGVVKENERLKHAPEEKKPVERSAEAKSESKEKEPESQNKSESVQSTEPFRGQSVDIKG